MALTDNIINYWKLDESSGNAADSVGTLTLTNSSATYGAALINNGFIGGGVGTLRNSASNTSLGTATAWTLNGWIWMSTTPSGANDFLVSIGDTTNQLTYNMYYRESGGLSLRGERVRDGVAVDLASFTTTLSTSVWHMVTLTYNTSQIELFLDATSVATAASTGSGSAGTTAGTGIGCTAGGAQPIRTNVKVDEFGIWTRQLSGAEITSLYNSGAGLQYPFSTGAAIRDARALTLLGVG